MKGTRRRGLRSFSRVWKDRAKAVLEACWNWGLTHDLIEEIESVEEVVPAHPLKTRLIADALVKIVGLYQSDAGCTVHPAQDCGVGPGCEQGEDG